MSAKTDTYYARLWRMTVGAIRNARVGDTFKDHTTPPDLRPRRSAGRRLSNDAILMTVDERPQVAHARLISGMKPPNR